MGSGNSTPVQHAKTVETEAHQDVFELRFDHLAFGGTTLLILAALIGLWFCRRRAKRRQQKRQSQCHCQALMSQPPQPAFPLQPMQMPPMPPMPWFPMMPYAPPSAASHWGPQPEPSRFTEIPEPTPQPPRPPPPRSRELPPPPSKRPGSTEDAVKLFYFHLICLLYRLPFPVFCVLPPHQLHREQVPSGDPSQPLMNPLEVIHHPLCPPDLARS